MNLYTGDSSPDFTLKLVKNTMNLTVPSYVQTALERLSQNGHEAYSVGGCVRDALDGRTPHDWDVCTSALPHETKRCFQDFRVIETGVQHGTVTVLIENEPIEITTYRIDGSYSDGRHPDAVSFTGNLREDLARRDFTINAMAYNPADGGTVVDPFGGQDDLKRRIIRCVGNPAERFSEDALRILRALRFSSVLRCRIEEKTAEAARLLRQSLQAVSPERRLSEFRKLIIGADAESILLRFADVLSAAVPGLPETLCFERAHQVGTAPVALDVRLALLLRGLNARAILLDLRAERALMDRVDFLVGRLEKTPPADAPAIKRLLREAGPEAVRSLLQALKADESTLNAILEANECWSLGQLAIRGADLTAVGVPAGPAIGKILNQLLEQVIDGALTNERNVLLQAAESLFSSVR